MGLTAHGYKFLEAANGKIAIGLLSESPDLVILDLGLPDIDGFEFLQKIRGHNQWIPIIVLSSRGDELTKVQALETGADDYVTKPFGMNELLARIRWDRISLPTGRRSLTVAKIWMTKIKMLRTHIC